MLDFSRALTLRTFPLGTSPSRHTALQPSLTLGTFSLFPITMRIFSLGIFRLFSVTLGTSRLGTSLNHLFLLSSRLQRDQGSLLDQGGIKFLIIPRPQQDRASLLDQRETSYYRSTSAGLSFSPHLAWD